MIAFALIMIVAVACAAVGIEQIAGYYECQLCQDRHVPAYWQTMLASHIVRNRYTKCPNCEKYSWQKKVLTKEDSEESVGVRRIQMEDQ